jgi:Inactive DUF488-N3 subclade
LQRADCLPCLLAEQPIDVDILAGPAERTMEATYLSALAADLKTQIPSRPTDGSRRHAPCNSADAFLSSRRSIPDIQFVDAAAQPGHPVPEWRYLDALVSSRQHHPDDLLKPTARKLVGSTTLPVGMEVFPSAGTGPWEVIRDATDDGDSYGVLVDRLWPRGVRKEEARLCERAKDIAPNPTSAFGTGTIPPLRGVRPQLPRRGGTAAESRPWAACST